MKWIGRTAERTLDLIIAVVMLLSLAIPLGMGLAINLEDGGSIFFRQQRVGLNGTPIRVWKFRTMTETRIDPQEPDRLTDDDPRVTALEGCFEAWESMSFRSCSTCARGDEVCWPPPDACVSGPQVY